MIFIELAANYPARRRDLIRRSLMDRRDCLQMSFACLYSHFAPPTEALDQPKSVVQMAQPKGNMRIWEQILNGTSARLACPVSAAVLAYS